jgi:hypothetical protein
MPSFVHIVDASGLASYLSVFESVATLEQRVMTCLRNAAGAQ